MKTKKWFPTLQVSGVDLAEIAGGEVAITNMHSCNGPEFVLQLHFSLKLGCSSAKSPGGNWSFFFCHDLQWHVNCQQNAIFSRF